ncbi:MAG: hypothetical protein GX147_05735 [Deltaproteobacteria bacterium]|nr:hypothetical protein [Deltaproteobacteria bacterium]
MKIGNPRLLWENKLVLYQVSVESARGQGTLWYSLDESFGDLVSNFCDAALAALLIPAMQQGEDIRIEGAVSEKLLHNLRRPYQRLLQRIIPTLRQVKIDAKEISTDQTIRRKGVAIGFSGGIDSYCALADHYDSTVTDGFKITHLLFNNVGSHGKGGERLFRERHARLVPVAESLGLPFIMINSNLDEFYQGNIGYERTHTPRNASVALLLQGGIGRYMYASAYNYRHVFVGPASSTAYSDTIALPLLSTETLDAFSVGSEYTRVEKTLRVSEVPESYRSLDVCVNRHNTSGYINCSTCRKCLRTLATLDIAGSIEPYSGVFDLEAYRRRRILYFAKLLADRSALPREIVEFARQRNFSWPISSRLMRPFFSVSNLTGRALKKLKQK